MAQHTLIVASVEIVVETYYDPKPVPSHSYDWCASELDYEPGKLQGRGATEDEALDDLQQQLAERQWDRSL